MNKYPWAVKYSPQTIEEATLVDAELVPYKEKPNTPSMSKVLLYIFILTSIIALGKFAKVFDAKKQVIETFQLVQGSNAEKIYSWALKERVLEDKKRSLYEVIVDAKSEKLVAYNNAHQQFSFLWDNLTNRTYPIPKRVFTGFDTHIKLKLKEIDWMRYYNVNIPELLDQILNHPELYKNKSVSIPWVGWDLLDNQSVDLETFFRLCRWEKIESIDTKYQGKFYWLQIKHDGNQNVLILFDWEDESIVDGSNDILECISYTLQWTIMQMISAGSWLSLADIYLTMMKEETVIVNNQFKSIGWKSISNAEKTLHFWIILNDLSWGTQPSNLFDWAWWGSFPADNRTLATLFLTQGYVYKPQKSLWLLTWAMPKNSNQANVELEKWAWTNRATDKLWNISEDVGGTWTGVTTTNYSIWHKVYSKSWILIVADHYNTVDTYISSLKKDRRKYLLVSLWHCLSDSYVWGDADIANTIMKWLEGRNGFDTSDCEWVIDGYLWWANIAGLDTQVKSLATQAMMMVEVFTDWTWDSWKMRKKHASIMWLKTRVRHGDFAYNDMEDMVLWYLIHDINHNDNDIYEAFSNLKAFLKWRSAK